MPPLTASALPDVPRWTGPAERPATRSLAATTTLSQSASGAGKEGLIGSAFDSRNINILHRRRFDMLAWRKPEAELMGVCRPEQRHPRNAEQIGGVQKARVDSKEPRRPRDQCQGVPHGQAGCRDDPGTVCAGVMRHPLIRDVDHPQIRLLLQDM